MNYIIHYDIAAGIISLVLFLHFITRRKIRTHTTKVFIWILCIHIIASALDALTAFMIDNSHLFSLNAHYLFNILYLWFCNSAPPAYFVYLMFITKGTRSHWSRFDYIRIITPWLIDIILILSTPFTKAVFYFTEDKVYLHNDYFYILYGISFVYLFMVLVQAISYRKVLKRSNIITVLVYTSLMIASIVLQMFFPSLLITQFAVAIAIILIYLSIENPNEYTDKKLGIYNRDGYILALKTAIEEKRRFRLTAIHLSGLKYLNQTIGVNNKDIILERIAKFFCSLNGAENVFHLSDNDFIVMIKDNDDFEAEVITKIQEEFKNPFSIGEFSVAVSTRCTILTYLPEYSLEHTIDLIDFALTELDANKEVSFFHADDKIFDKKRRETLVLAALKQSLYDQSLQVFYQPIYSVKKQRYTAAEALVRMPVTEFGYVGPNEFIPIAEKHGCIFEVGEFVLRSVCKFLSKEQPWERGIECVHINISVVQCMYEKLAQHFIDIMDEWNLPRGVISLEVTETTAIMSKDSLSITMSRFISEGIKFALDDYGTGFSNATNLYEYPYNIIKIDKSIIQTAMNNDNAKKILKHSIAMIKSLDREIVAEGVETLEQATVLEEMGCDYFQGYYFSKPICERDFISFVK